MDWLGTIKTLAPTVATALGGPLAGAAVEALGSALGVSAPTQEKIGELISNSQMTSDQVAAIKQLELKYQDDEKQRQFSYEELTFKDRDSARQYNTQGGIQKELFLLSLLLLLVTLGCEMFVLFQGYPKSIPEIVVGRILGLMDAVAMMVLSYYYGTSHTSAVKSNQLAQQANN